MLKLEIEHVDAVQELKLMLQDAPDGTGDFLGDGETEARSLGRFVSRLASRHLEGEQARRKARARFSRPLINLRTAVQPRKHTESDERTTSV